MKVLGICCSGRLHGNTEILLQEVLDSAKEAGAEIELVTLAGKDIKPCDGCGACQKTGKCHIKDDIPDIYAKISEADGIIFGTPIYVWTLTAQAKILLDRSFAYGERRIFRKKVGGVVVTTGRIGCTSAVSVFNNFMASRKMVNAGAVMGFSGTMTEDKVKHYGAKDKIREDKIAMKEARDLGKAVIRRIVEVKILEKYAAAPVAR